MANEITITEGTLDDSARKYRKELLLMPIIGLKRSLAHLTLRTGIRHEEVVGEMDGVFELHSFTGEASFGANPNIKPRTLKTFLGSCEKLMLPQSLLSTIYGTAVTQGDKLKNVPINKAILGLMAKKISKGLNQSLFNAVRNDAGTTTAELFNGFDTTTAAEIVAATIATGNGNLLNLTEAIDVNNAVDQLKAIYRAASDELQDEDRIKMFIPRTIYNHYVDDYQVTVGSVPYNKEFKKTFLEGSDNSCELVPLIGKKNTPYIHLTTKNNMLVGVNQVGEEEKIEVRRGDNPYKLQFITTMFFGTQIESLSKERLLVAKLFVA